MQGPGPGALASILSGPHGNFQSKNHDASVTETGTAPPSPQAVKQLSEAGEAEAGHGPLGRCALPPCHPSSTRRGGGAELGRRATGHTVLRGQGGRGDASTQSWTSGRPGDLPTSGKLRKSTAVRAGHGRPLPTLCSQGTCCQCPGHSGPDSSVLRHPCTLTGKCVSTSGQHTVSLGSFGASGTPVFVT